VFKGKVPHCVIPNQRNSLPWGVLKKRQCLQDNIGNRVDYEHKRYKRADDELGFSYAHFKYYKEQFQVPVYAVPFVFGITSTTIILIIIIFSKDMRSDTNMYIFNLAISDLILVTLFFFLALSERAPIMLHYFDINSLFFTFFYRLSFGLSAYSVALLNIHRYRVTVNPSQVCFYSQTTWLAAVAKLCRLWIVAALFALPSTLWVIIIPKYEMLFDATFYKYLDIFDLSVSCVIPLVVIAISYIMTELHHMKIPCSTFDRTQNPELNTRKITAKIVSGLNFVFMISYVPHCALKTYSSFNMTGEISSVTLDNMLRLYEYSTFLLLINSCLNPVALFCTNRALRHHLKRYLTCCCKAKSYPIDIEPTRRN
jgi:hypothetical protein